MEKDKNIIKLGAYCKHTWKTIETYKEKYLIYCNWAQARWESRPAFIQECTKCRLKLRV
jgi:hypothetical protein